jgi:hypothetical protein
MGYALWGELLAKKVAMANRESRPLLFRTPTLEGSWPRIRKTSDSTRRARRHHRLIHVFMCLDWLAL